MFVRLPLGELTLPGGKLRFGSIQTQVIGSFMLETREIIKAKQLTK